MAQLQEPAQTVKRPDFVNGVRVRMPEDYDFNTWGKKYDEYDKDFKLRTDAVWEKYQLRDWFRLSRKWCFFHSKKKKFLFNEPQFSEALLHNPWNLGDDDFFEWENYSPTGATTCFQNAVGPKLSIENTFNSFYSLPDYWIMWLNAFEKWWRCDRVYGGDKRILDYDRNPDVGLHNVSAEDTYPCFREYYETVFACADNIIKLLIQLSYAKKSQAFYENEISNREIKSFPTVYDSPKAPERITLTY